MNNDIRPPQPMKQPPVQSSEEPVQTATQEPDQVGVQPLAPAAHSEPKLPWWKRRLFFAIAALAVGIVVAVIGSWIWYTIQLQAVSPGSEEKVKVVIEPGSDTSAIASKLKENGLIRNEQAFLLYVRLGGASGALQSGTYRLGKADGVATLVDHLTSGKTDTFSITFLPGDTLDKHRKALIDAGYEPEVVDRALNKDYEGPLFDGKPKNADLEGYIYGETYNFEPEASPEEILERTFEEMQNVVEENNLKASFDKQGLSLYEGITLASIIQREVVTTSDMAQVSQVFQLRLKRDMQLGSDVTYQYAADKMGVPRDVNLDSPYNTRRFEGLPPGPIASPSADALISVGSPAKGDFVYFLSGDDDKTYFARTNEEHEKNIRDHCEKKCQII